ncbi:DeoR/GlpR family DNA-binding transcription regulator [Gilliamella sp. wkB112]|uniref:DeoR/GlpR family DNA-binding transcription regulator n=1 Tax=Gilliamella sp. wkB112 TaxID=3120257 RepID=UPI0009BFBBBE|nr:DeoR/GlpR family DNA-binding transcription regulator [Gilliamella apicola]
MSNLYAEERLEKIVTLVESQQRVSVPELERYFKVSGATIRADLRKLENENRILRTHGGAIPYQKKIFEDLPASRKNEASKVKIAKKAIEYIENKDTILLDTGTTCWALAQEISSRGFTDLTVVTHDLKIAMILEIVPHIEVILIGGKIRKNFSYTHGSQVIQSISDYSVDKGFIATSAFSIENGFSTPNIETAAIKKSMILASKEVFMLTDSSKYGLDSFKKFASFKDIECLIINQGIPEPVITKLKSKGLTIIIV